MIAGITPEKRAEKLANLYEDLNDVLERQAIYMRSNTRQNINLHYAATQRIEEIVLQIAAWESSETRCILDMLDAPPRAERRKNGTDQPS